MQVKAITVNAAGLAQGWGIQGNMPQVIQPEKSGYSPECRVTISQEGKDLSRQQIAVQAEKHAQNVEAGKMQAGRQEEYVGLKKSLADMYKEMGYYGEELRQLTESQYEKYCQAYPAGHGGIQPVSSEGFTEEEIAAMNERARQSKENLDKILKSMKNLTPTELANAIPLTFDYVAELPRHAGNGSQE